MHIKANFPGLQTALVFRKAQEKCNAAEQRSKLRRQLNIKANAQSDKLKGVLEGSGANNIVAL